MKFLSKEKVRKSRLPYGTAVLVLGISSIALCCCYGLPGIMTGTIALILYRRDKKIYDKDRQRYDNFENLKTGKTLSIIGISISSLYLLYLIFAAIAGKDVVSDPSFIWDWIV